MSHDESQQFGGESQGPYDAPFAPPAADPAQPAYQQQPQQPPQPPQQQPQWGAPQPMPMQAPWPGGGQQQAGQSPYAAPGSGMPPQYGGYPPVPPAKKNTGLIIGLVVGAVVVVGGIGAFAALGSSGSPSSSVNASSTGSAASTAAAPTTATDTAAASTTATDTAAASTTVSVSLPSSAGGLTLLATANAKAEVARVRTGVDEGGAVYDKALLGAYGPKANGGYRVVLVDQAFANMPADDQSQFESYAPSDLVQTLTSGLKLSDIQVDTSTDSAAAISCGVFTSSGLKFPACVWVDSNTFGFAYFYTNYFTTGLPAAAKYTDALRAAAEGQ